MVATRAGIQDVRDCILWSSFSKKLDSAPLAYLTNKERVEYESIIIT
jgi:hypothetical protein